MVDIKLLRTTGALLNIVRGESETGNNIIEAADRIDALEARLKEYDGATVVEVDDKTDCLFCDGDLSYCHLDDDGNGCVMPFARFHGSKLTDCPLRRGAVIVKMKKEQ